MTSSETPEANRVASIINSYTDAMSNDVIDLYYGGSKFMNLGYWDAGITNQAMASRQLVNELLNLTDLGTGKIADVACGLGATTHHISQQLGHTNITGVNISPYQVMRCKENFPSLDFRVMNAVDLEFEDNSIDAVISVEAACHFNTRRKFFSECARVLTPGGKLVFSDTIFYREFVPKMHWMSPPGNTEHTIDDYRATLEATGFKITNIREAMKECWETYPDMVRRWALTQHLQGKIDTKGLQTLLYVAKVTRKLPVKTYILLSAVRT
jgi:ubiquinone/menaquinone biosynthesis C-methylase UbiE